MYVDHTGNPDDHDHDAGVDSDDVVQCFVVWWYHVETVSKVRDEFEHGEEEDLSLGYQ